MSEYNQNQNNPSGIWQHIWVTLTIQALEEFSQKKYISSFNTLKMLKSQLPPECEKDCIKNFEKIDLILKKTATGYNQQAAQEMRTSYIQEVLPEPLLELMGVIRKSLFDKGWINKSFGAKPKFGGGGTL